MVCHWIVLLMFNSCVSNSIITQGITNTIGQVLTSILETYFIDSQRHFLVQFSNDEGRYEQLDVFTEAIVFSRRLIPIKFKQDYSPGMQPSSYNLLLIESYQSFLRIYEKIDPMSYDYSGLYVIVYCQGEYRFSLMQSIFSEMWQKKIINVIVIAAGSSVEVLIYSYLPYQPHICGHPYPILVANISDSNPQIGDDLFPERLGDLFGCSLKAGVILLEPFVISVDNSSIQKYTGLEISIVETVAQQHNFTIKYVLPQDLKRGSIEEINSTGLLGLIQEETVDMGFGSIAITPERSFYLKAGTAHYTSILVFAVPSGRPFTSFEKLYKPFSLKAWLWIMFMYAGREI
ncbi:uncharacterized protein LOC129773880 [Toxorhynchites rutilus septentrionalis]|uniref:uncharacterized protein LOC129773880 n=1 Tax=Toxorhynchites rutilus septentrionalis TaxID=329112 RepID=UPI0024792A84|nr:uncharacterized protein LOC129773880 [Toxorhynchites rutilus septentrionalis]